VLAWARSDQRRRYALEALQMSRQHALEGHPSHVPSPRTVAPPPWSLNPTRNLPDGAHSAPAFRSVAVPAARSADRQYPSRAVDVDAADASTPRHRPRQVRPPWIERAA
jgi:hypothetical protein